MCLAGKIFAYAFRKGFSTLTVHQNHQGSLEKYPSMPHPNQSTQGRAEKYIAKYLERFIIELLNYDWELDPENYLLVFPYLICLICPPPNHLSPQSASTSKPFNASLCVYLAVQSCRALCGPMSCSPPGSSDHGIFQARILAWVAISYSRGSSQPRDRTHVSWISADSSPLSHQGSPVPL